MPASKAQQRAVTKYVKTRYDRFGLTMPKGCLDEIKAAAAARGESVNGFINRAIDSQMGRDTSSGPTEAPTALSGAVSLPPRHSQGRQRGCGGQRGGVARVRW